MTDEQKAAQKAVECRAIRPKRWLDLLNDAATAAELEALLPAILNRAFNREL